MNEVPATPQGALPVSLRHLEVRFGGRPAVHDLSIDIRPGEILALLGPSGCGKTTTLKAIAGLQPLDGGSIYFGDRRINDLPSHRRNVGMVFQNYALFPHMRVIDNVLFGLKMHGVAREEANRRAFRVLDMLDIRRLAGAPTARLSGGEQQRVALARTLVVEPSVILLDEPLSALDRQLRDAMRKELRRVLNQVGITAVFVTHDQDEAITIADRIVVMRNGRIEQVGTPQEVYLTPRTRFVANFIGEINCLSGEVVQVGDGVARLVLPGGSEIRARHFGTCRPGEKADVAVRPEVMMIRLSGDNTAVPPMHNAVSARVTRVTFAGGTTDFEMQISEGIKLVVVQTDNAASGYGPAKASDTVQLVWPIDRSVIIAESSQPPAEG